MYEIVTNHANMNNMTCHLLQAVLCRSDNVHLSARPVIAQLVERRTVVGTQTGILRSAVRLRLAGMSLPFATRLIQHSVYGVAPR